MARGQVRAQSRLSREPCGCGAKALNTTEFSPALSVCDLSDHYFVDGWRIGLPFEKLHIDPAECPFSTEHEAVKRRIGNHGWLYWNAGVTNVRQSTIPVSQN